MTRRRIRLPTGVTISELPLPLSLCEESWHPFFPPAVFQFDLSSSSRAHDLSSSSRAHDLSS